MSTIVEKIAYKARQVLGLKSRESLLKLLPKDGVCAELGVFRGDFSRQILKHARPREAHFIDVWWEAFGEFYPNWGVYTDFGKLKTRTAYEEACEKIKGFPARSTVHVGDDLRYLTTFSDHYFDWAYIDSSHNYDHTWKELSLLNGKIKPGGIICGHDWHDEEEHEHAGVRKAVQEFCAAEGWQVFYRDGYTQWAIKRNR